MIKQTQSTTLAPCVAIFVLLTMLACQRTKSVTTATTIPQSSPEPSLAANTPDISVTEFLKQADMAEKENQSSLVRTWKRVPAYDHYRVSRPGDFRLPKWVEKEAYWSDIERALDHPSDFGEMGGAEGLALIIVDRTVSDAKRFSCVVFISRPGNRYDLYWIFHNEDLSHFTMGRHSGDVYLWEHRDDGTSHVCDIQWSRKQRKWARIKLTSNYGNRSFRDIITAQQPCPS